MKAQVVLFIVAFAKAGAATSSLTFDRHDHALGLSVQEHKFKRATTVSYSGARKPIKKQRVPICSHGLKNALDIRGGSVIPLPSKEEGQGIAFFIVADYLFRLAFQKLQISFPSQLGGCCILFTFFMLVNAVACGHASDAMVSVIAPGGAWLIKWLPVFFVPGLAMLPLAPSIGSSLEIAKVLSLLLVGFFVHVFVIGKSVEIVLSLQGKTTISSPPPSPAKPASRRPPLAAKKAAPNEVANDKPVAPKPPFTAEVLNLYLAGTAISGALSIAAKAKNTGGDWETISRTLFTSCATLSGFVLGSRMPSKVTKIVHPLFWSTACSWLAVWLYGATTGSDFKSVLSNFKASTMNIKKAGTADILLYMLGPAVVSFCLPVYSRKNVLQENLLAVIVGVLTASLFGLFGAALYTRLLNFSSTVLRISVLPRFITTALAIPVTNILGGNVPIAASLVVLTGVFAGSVGPMAVDLLKIENPIARGLSVGGAGNALGAASLIPEIEAFPFAVSSMVLTAVAVTSLVSIPWFREILLSATLGE